MRSPIHGNNLQKTPICPLAHQAVVVLLDVSNLARSRQVYRDKGCTQRLGHTPREVAKQG